jgi:predicted dehydrogenase
MDPGGYGPSSTAAIAAWLRAVRGEAPVPVGLDDMARALEVIDAAYQSATHGGQRVRIAIRAPS